LLQYHLYLVALHRFLGTRMRSYDYGKHMGGAWYVFLRGVDGTEEHGWYHDRPKRALIEAMDGLLAGGG
jgi:exodeoxyribonuclease V beta subunit